MHMDYWEPIDLIGGVMVASSLSFMMKDYQIFHDHYKVMTTCLLAIFGITVTFKVFCL